MLSFRGFWGAWRPSLWTLLCAGSLTLCMTLVHAQKAREATLGLAWNVRGSWQVAGKPGPLASGDSVQPGELLRAAGSESHSITVLLSDGQSIRYECYTAEDCARGFRVPAFFHAPEPFAVEMLAHLQTILHRDSQVSSGESSSRKSARLPLDEALVVLDRDNNVHVAGLASSLPNGRYSCDLRSFDQINPRRSHLSLEKTASSLTVSLPSPGVYIATITDDLNMPRIELFLAAIRPTQAANFKRSYGQARALMEKWNEYSQAWPAHELQRAYLEWLMDDKKGLTIARQSQREGKTGVNQASGIAAPDDRAGVTAEPTFSPKPGRHHGEVAITLSSGTAGAIIHYTVDGSLPSSASTIYHAPVIVQANELTIKAFASSPQMKDSPVVTGIFQIQE